MALTPERIEALFLQSDGTFLGAGRAIEAEVRKQDAALIRQMLDAFESDRLEVEDWPEASRTALAAARAWLEGAPPQQAAPDNSGFLQEISKIKDLPPPAPGLVPLADVLARVDACMGPNSAVRLALEREFGAHGLAPTANPEDRA